MRHLLRVAVVVLLGVGLAVAPAAAASADEETADFDFASFEADYYLSRADDGSSRLLTVETLVAEFPDRDQNRGIVRAIPSRFEGADLGVEIESVTDADGAPVPYEESDDDGFRELAIGTDAFVRGEQTYVITYERRNVTRSYDDTGADELYLDTNGTGWAQPFGELTATVHVDSDLVGALTGDAACYVGEEGSTDRCPIEEGTDDGGATFTSTASELAPEQNVTVAIGFDVGTFSEPARARDSVWAAAVPIGVGALALLALAAVIVTRLTRWRDARGRGILIPQYTGLEGVDLLEAGSLVGRQPTALSAQLLSFAVRGVLRVLDADAGADARDDTRDDTGEGRYSLELVSDRGVTGAERDLLKVLFGGSAPGSRREVGDTGIAAQLHAQVTAASGRLTVDGLRRTIPVRQLVVFWLVGSLVSVVPLVALITLAALDALTFWSGAVLIVAFVVGVAVIALASKRTALTPAGAVARDHLLGVRDYLQLAEADRMRMLQSPTGAERVSVDPQDPRQLVRLSERLLPYAVLFGVEKQWTPELERLYAESGDGADWYAGRSSFDAASFAVLMSTVNRQSAAVATPWTGSSASGVGGGSTGGGFSGGGMGGGGGGGR